MIQELFAANWHYFLVALASSLVVCRVMIFLAPRMRLVDVPRGRKNHEKVTPLGGGVAVFIALTLSVGLCCFSGDGLSGSNMDSGKLVFVLLVGTIIFSTGLIDDIKGLPAWSKLFVQVTAAIMLFAVGVKITVFVYSPVVNMIATVLWVVLLINSFNLLDTMDGLSGSVSAIIAMVAVLSLGNHLDPFLAFLLVAYFCSVLGFLVFNFPPAKIFMGDAGSLFIGYILAVSSIEMTFFSPEWDYDPLLAMFVPLVLFSVPMYDTFSVVLIRIRSKKSIFVGDNNHMPHRLLSLGLSKREVLFIICLITLITSAGTIYLPVLSRLQACLVLLQVLSLFILLFILETIGERKNG